MYNIRTWKSIFFIVHVGFNDIMNGSAEIKMDFKELIDSLLDTNQIPIISGPVPVVEILNKICLRYQNL
jgi:hypothetical protein